MDLEELAREQEVQSHLVRRFNDPPINSSIVTGVDVSYSENQAVGCAVVSDIATHETLDIRILETEIDSEYISGFFQLREGPIILELLRSLETTGTVLVDGNGILHPRRFGLASYVGLKLNIQAVGVAKSLLLGEIRSRIHDIADIIDGNEIIGRALWLGEKRPIYVSIGHRISLDTAVRVVRDSCVDDYPGVLLQAHIKSKNELKKLQS
ncbi:endonuclease V [Candidatus Thorarchaeota archaeon]|nr:MAG: endonuclease V [Candidatus Thorarchaeota archaeon]